MIRSLYAIYRCLCAQNKAKQDFEHHANSKIAEATAAGNSNELALVFTEKLEVNVVF